MCQVLAKTVEVGLIIEILSVDRGGDEDGFYIVVLDKPGNDKRFEEYEGKDLIVTGRGNPISRIVGMREKEEVEINGSKIGIKRIVGRYEEKN